MPLAGGYSFVPWVLKGDMDFAIHHFQLPGHWNSSHPCPTCPCVRQDGHPMRWNDFSTGALWKGFVFETMEPFVAHCALKSKQVHHIFKTLEDGGLGMHILSQYKDTLHVVDLGVSMHAAGNVLWLLCYELLGNIHQANIAQVWGEVQQLYKERDTSAQLCFLSIRQFCNPDSPNVAYPLLKGKGADNRHLIPILLVIWRKHCCLHFCLLMYHILF